MASIEPEQAVARLFEDSWQSPEHPAGPAESTEVEEPLTTTTRR
jgi:hypothetical protein